ncbi:hypothetical protein HRbin15_01968 [bacterium HR15]|nr:hypothetical protein HRbin15_01968 [bacterium HR15]
MHTEPEWRRWLMRKAVHLCYCEADAEDLVQDCLYAFYRRFHYYPWQRLMQPDELRQAQAWCYCKLRSLAIDRARQPYCQHERQLLDTELGERLVTEDYEAALLERIAMEQFITRLPASLQRVAVLYNQGYDYAEIGAMLGLSVGTVRQYMRQIKQLGQAFFRDGRQEIGQ